MAPPNSGAQSTSPFVDIPLAGTIPHNLGKSDLSTTFNVSALSTRQKLAVYFPIMIHPSYMGPEVILLPGPLRMTPVPLIKHPVRSLELYFEQEALLASLASAGGRQLVNDFFSNTMAKKEVMYREESTVSNLVRDNSTFQTNARTFETEFVRRMRLVRAAEGGNFHPDKLRADLDAQGGPMNPPALPFFGVGSKLGILGSFQESRVRLVRLETPTAKGFTATLRYELFDHFGCDDSDLEGLPSHGTPGQIAMWLLARDPKNGPGHKPFVVRIHVSRTVKDTQP